MANIQALTTDNMDLQNSNSKESSRSPVVKPLLSIIVILHNMRREAPRTLYTMSDRFQQGVEADNWEVIVIENGSGEPMREEDVEQLGPQFHYIQYETRSVSPVTAINEGARLARGRYLAVSIDGARLISPGVVRYTLAGLRAFPNAMVCTLAWHLGHKVQNQALLEGYNQAEEDQLLNSVDWRGDGYRLFDISCLADSSKSGFGEQISESNFFGLPATLYWQLGGFDERFMSPGGGLANLDFYKRVNETPGVELIHLLGEGTFHQFHGGVATNVAPEDHPRDLYHSEYQAIRDVSYKPPIAPITYVGTMPPASRKFFAMTRDDHRRVGIKPSRYAAFFQLLKQQFRS